MSAGAIKSSPKSSALSAFEAAFGGRPTHLGRSPARVELLGNHTDYNGGLVMAAAIDRETVVVGRRATGRWAKVRASDLGGFDEFDLDAISPGPPGHWANYIRGVAWQLQDWLGPARMGFELAIAGNVPRGAGLSSSASLQAALAGFLLESGVFGDGGMPGPDQDDSRMTLAGRLRRSENEFVGVASGLLDQFAVLFGREGGALGLDCRSLAFERVPLGQPPPSIVVCDSKTSRRLADGMYNRRRAEGERVVEHFRITEDRPEVVQLRDLELEDLEANWDDLDPVGRLRARHVIRENARVADGLDALRRGDSAGLGSLMTASHASSRDDFENSSEALDALIEAASQAPGFLGGKLSGAGWAGCTVNLVEADLVDEFAESVRRDYAKRLGIDPAIHACRAAQGASADVLDPNA